MVGLPQLGSAGRAVIDTEFIGIRAPLRTGSDVFLLSRLFLGRCSLSRCDSFLHGDDRLRILIRIQRFDLFYGITASAVIAFQTLRFR